MVAGSNAAATASSANASANAKEGSTTNKVEPNALEMVIYSLYFVAIFQGFYYAIGMAYDIRLYAIKEYGRVIHEFDPYFNYRATEYLWEHGWHAFSHWYDDMVWYPLGRPVGTTIYPGMQVTSVAIKQYILPDWSINDICCFVPAWFGSLATMGAAWLAYECTQDHTNMKCSLGQIYGVNWVYESFVAPMVSMVVTGIHKATGSTWGLPQPYVRKPSPAVESALWAALIMSIVPAHLLRSVAGGYDNESVATTAMVVTFAAWTRTLRDNTSDVTTIAWGIITGLCYFYMVAAWGGYVFVINLIGVHASFLVLVGRFSGKLHKAYTSFYIVGTLLAMQVPVVGWAPLKSLEQMGPFIAFAGMQLLEYCRRQQVARNLNFQDLWKLRIRVFAMLGGVFLILIFLLAPTGYFGPFSSRIRGLFVKHTKTGNPLVDSVAEHQAASPSAYFQYLNDVLYIAPVGFGLVLLAFCNDSSSFLIIYGIAAYFFSHRMVRLILLTAPIASTLGGIALGHLTSWMVGSVFPQTPNACAMWAAMMGGETEIVTTPPPKETAPVKSVGKKDKKKGGAKNIVTETKTVVSTGARDPYIISAIRLAFSVYICVQLKPRFPAFYSMCDQMAQQISHPTIIQKARTKGGEEVKIDDYRDAYFWLKDNTPEDARIMAWWDYGYQITGIANRTTIADGNTWNHEHIALLGKTLTSSERDGHRVARHLADYILVWTGGGGDDLAKSPHLIRIANSVYRGLCSEPTCREFGYYSNGEPSERMAESMLYKLHSHKLKPGVEADPNRFKLVYQSKYGKVRIFKVLKVSKESKEWVKDKKNKLCDGGGWVCRGQYPPALQKILVQKQDFQQLEDFNIKGGDDSDYQKQYMDGIQNPGKKNNKQTAPKQLTGEKKEAPRKPKKISVDEIEMFNKAWENNELTSHLWELISQNRLDEFKELAQNNPAAAHVRSDDGRGPMWWAHEYKRTGFIEALRKMKVSEKRQDKNGKTPLDS